MLDKRFDHKKEEPEIYQSWEKSGFFNPDNLVEKGIIAKDAEPFSIVLPPPNVTGTLHMGHAFMLVIEDAMIRFARMQGKRALWIPGTDHAAIATQSKVEKEIYKKTGESRHDLGREKFLKKVEKFAQESHDTIITQIKAMGASLDWSREAYTLDKQRSLAVRTAFKKMYDMGLIYKGHRTVNWDPKMRTTVSDDEMEYKEEKAPFYYFKYGPFVIGTARPETKFGDKYVVVNPNDKRYEKYKHKEKIDVDWVNGKIVATVIKDGAVDPEFGTGAMTITPWHDATDFEIAERHNLDKEQIINFEGKLLSVAGEFEGLSIKEGRQKIVEKLREKGLLVKVDENYTHRIAGNSRGGGTIEPQIMEQWFVDVNKEFVMEESRIDGIKKGEAVSLKALMKKVVENDEIKILPKRFSKIYFHWIENLRDWCISRQIWYGHRIPVYYCSRGISGKGALREERSLKTGAKCTEPIVSIEEIDKCPSCDGEILQDPDTLDTWFSSGLWTFSTLGWPLESGRNDSQKASLLDVYHPTSVLETGYDILFFWVARMILMSTCLLGEVPFKAVYLHGMVRDKKGQKMSKSLDNSIDPRDMIEKYGADATRLSLIVGIGPGSDVNLSEEKVRAYRNFGTKVWNVARFLEMNKPSSVPPVSKNFSNENLEETKLGPEEGKDLSLDKENGLAVKEVQRLKKEVADHYKNYEFNLAGEKAYDHLWNFFANKIIEKSKPVLKNGNEQEKANAYLFLEALFLEYLKMLHPLMPFVTEAVYRELKLGNENFLMVEKW